MKKNWRALLIVCLMATTAVCWGEEPVPAPAVPPAPDAKTEADPAGEPTPIESAIKGTSPEEIFAEPGDYQVGQPIVSECNNCGECDSCCNSCSPKWTVSAGAVFLTRDNGDETVLIRNAQNLTAPSLLNADDLDHDYEFGYTIDVTRHFETFDLQGNFFAVDGWNASGGSTVAGAAYSGPGGLFNGGGQIEMDYSSDLASGELNLKPHFNSMFRPFTGFRWLQLNERLLQSGNSFAGGFGPEVNIDTHNDLYGLQLGTDLLLVTQPRFELTATGKITIAANAARNNVQLLGNAAGVGLTDEFGTRTTKVAFIYDLAMNGKYRISEHVSLTGGYSVMFLSQVALAPGQLEHNSAGNGVFIFGVPTSPAGSRAVNRGSLLVHGGKAALEITW